MKTYRGTMTSDGPRIGETSAGRSLSLCIGPFILAIGIAKRKPFAGDALPNRREMAA